MDTSIVKFTMVLSSVNKPPNSSGDKHGHTRILKCLWQTGGLTSVKGQFFYGINN